MNAYLSKIVVLAVGVIAACEDSVDGGSTDADADRASDGCGADACGQADVPDFDPTCGNDARWVIDGSSVFDCATGLQWERSASALSGATWSAASSYCDGLDLADHDDWRLPSLLELRGLINGCVATDAEGSCPTTDDAPGLWTPGCLGCAANGGDTVDGCYLDEVFERPDDGCGQLASSATWHHPNAPAELAVCTVAFETGAVGNDLRAGSAFDVRCVRDTAPAED